MGDNSVIANREYVRLSLQHLFKDKLYITWLEANVKMILSEYTFYDWIVL